MSKNAKIIRPCTCGHSRSKHHNLGLHKVCAASGCSCEDYVEAKAFSEHLKQATETVSKWPAWKQNVLENLPGSICLKCGAPVNPAASRVKGKYTCKKCGVTGELTVTGGTVDLPKAPAEMLTSNELEFLRDCMSNQPVSISRDYAQEDLEAALGRKIKRMIKEAKEREKPKPFTPEQRDEWDKAQETLSRLRRETNRQF